jgi:hypothetical protein
VSAFVSGIDRLLSRGHDLFPASGGAGNVGNDPGPVPPPVSTGGGQLGAGATQAGDDYERSRSAMSSLGDDANEAADDANTVGAQGRVQSGAIRDNARTQAAAIEPTTTQPAGVKLMVSTMDQRLSDMQRELDTAQAENRLIAARMRQVAAAYQSAGLSGMGGGGVPPTGSGVATGAGSGSGMGGLGGLAAVPGALTHRPHGGSANPADASVRAPASGPPPMRVPNPSQADLQAYIIAKGRQLGLTPTEIGMTLAVAKHESNWNPVGFMGFGPEAKSVGLNFDNDSYGAIDRFYKQYTERLPASLNRNSPTAIADFIWHTVHAAADPHYGPSLLAAYESYRRY